jgi:hypothetical protein
MFHYGTARRALVKAVVAEAATVSSSGTQAIPAEPRIA